MNEMKPFETSRNGARLRKHPTRISCSTECTGLSAAFRIQHHAPREGRQGPRTPVSPAKAGSTLRTVRPALPSPPAPPPFPRGWASLLLPTVSSPFPHRHFLPRICCQTSLPGVHSAEDLPGPRREGEPRTGGCPEAGCCSGTLDSSSPVRDSASHSHSRGDDLIQNPPPALTATP